MSSRFRSLALLAAAPALMSSIALGNQSLVLSPGNTGAISIPASGPFVSLQNTRVEFRVHSWTVPASQTYLVYTPNLSIYFRSSGELCAFDTVDRLPDYGGEICAAVTGFSDITVRIQRDLANMVFRLEVWNSSNQASVTTYCGTIQNTGNSVQFPCPISSAGTGSWAGSGSVGGTSTSADLAWLKWFSTTVPPGGSPSAESTPADLADWRFEGNLTNQGAGGYAVNMSGHFNYVNSPIYPPACNAGAQYTLRAGYPGQLNGTQSSPLDGGNTLSYLWQQISGPAPVKWSSQTAAQPGMSRLLFGDYIFQLTVTDGNQQSSTCTVELGAVASDNNGVIITNNAAVDTLLGPMIRYGANPWPWFDDRNLRAASIQIANMDTYYGDYWDTAGPGTISVTTNSTAVVGNGTHFTTTFCQGPGSPTVPKSDAAIIVWYSQGGGLTGHRAMSLSSCTDDAHMTAAVAWQSDVTGGSGLSYTEVDDSDSPAWNYGPAPANYYDNVEGLYALYYRTGLTKYLTAARKLADRFWESPQIDRGYAFDDSTGGINFPPRSASMLGLFLRAMDNPPNSMWSGLRKVEAAYEANMNSYYPAQGGLYDERDQAYELATMAYCAMFDPDPTSNTTCKTTISNSVASTWTPFQYSDKSWPMFIYQQGWSSFDTLTTVTMSGTSVTASGGTPFTPAMNGAMFWAMNSEAKPGVNQSNPGDTTTYTFTYVDSSHGTLDRSYTGSAGSHGWAMIAAASLPSDIGWLDQPYMMGLLTTAFDLSSRAIATSDPKNSAQLSTYRNDAANWIKTYGYWPLQRGYYYFVNGVLCVPPISDSNTNCTIGYDISQSRTLAAETIRGLGSSYLNTGDSAMLTFINNEYNAMFSKPGTGGPNPDGTYITYLDDGGLFMSGTPPLGQAPKWFGQFFGFGDGAVWPAMSQGGALQKTTAQIQVEFNLANVPGAASVVVSGTAPSGNVVQAQCTSSPCTLTIDPRQGDYLLRLTYLSAGGVVLAQASEPTSW